MFRIGLVSATSTCKSRLLFSFRPDVYFYPLSKPKISPGTNPMRAVKGNPEAAKQCAANCELHMQRCYLNPTPIPL
jgi:hypothetical protein